MSHEHNHAHHSEHVHEEESKKEVIFKLIVSAIMFVVALIVDRFVSNSIAIILNIVAYLIVGFDVLKEAIESIIHKEFFDEEFLMAIASVGAICVGSYAEAVAVMILYCLGEMLEDMAVDKSRDSISDLMNIRPDYANLLVGPEEKKVDPGEVSIGDVIVIKPGEKIPLDGIVVEGTSLVDTSNLTGESVPKSVGFMSEVISGCINNTGRIKVKVSKEYRESTVSKILNLVEEASEKKSSSENFITKFSHIYTPTVCVIAIILAFVPSLIFGQELSIWVYRACTFLVVSCPCALVISVPLSFFAGIGAGSKEGILVKGSNYFETLANTRIAVFDKTGTLTEGTFQVVNKSNISEETIKYAAYAESSSSHPIALSIIRAYEKEIDKSQIESITEKSGLGIYAKAFGKEIFVGNDKLMEEENITYEKCNEEGTIVYVALDNQFLGSIVIADKIKEESKDTINDLYACGVDRCVMLTGDNETVAKSIASQTGINEIHAGLLPVDKVSIVEKLLKEKNEGSLIFTGDGVNDAPVLKRADVGIAMGALGSDAAIEAADVVIMDDKISKLPIAIKLSRRTIKISKQNIIFALGVKIVVLVLSAFGLTSMWTAVFADVGVALLCILNSMRNLKRIN